MKILLIHNYYQYYGGEETYFELLVKLLRKNRHKVITYTKKSSSIVNLSDKISVALGLIWNLRTNNELTNIIRRFKPDIAHLNNLFPLIGSTAYRVLRENNVPIVQTVHNYRFLCPKGILFRKGEICELCLGQRWPIWSIVYGCYHHSKLASWFFSMSFYIHNLIGSYRLVNQWIFPSEFTRNYYLNNLNIPKNKTKFLPYFVDLKPIGKPVQRGRFYTFIGRLSEEKGIIELLQLFAKSPKYELKIIGDGPLRKEVEKFTVYPNIKVLGFLNRRKISKYLQQTKALILTSKWYEVLPSVLLESLVLKTPALVLKNNNLKAVLKNNSHMFFKDFKELRNKLGKKMVFKISAEHLESYLPSGHLEKLITIYKRVLHN